MERPRLNKKIETLDDMPQQEVIEEASNVSSPESRAEFRSVVGGMIAKIESRQGGVATPEAANDNLKDEKVKETLIAANDNEDVPMNEMKQEVKLAKKAGVHEEHTKVHELEDKFFNLYKKTHTEGNLMSRFKHHKEFSETSKEYDEARLAHAKALQNSVEKRLSSPEREAKLLAQYTAIASRFDDRGKSFTFEEYKASQNEKLSKRYNSWIRYNEVHKPKIEAKQKARFESLDTKGQNIFLKAVSWYPKAMHGLENKFGKSKVRAARLLLTASLAVGGATVAGAGVGVAALLGTFALLRSGAFMVGGAAAIGGADKGFRNTVGKSRKATREETHGEGIASLADLERHDSSHRKGSDAGIESSARKVQLATTTITALVAFGFSHEAAAQVAHISSIHGAADQLSHGGGGSGGNLPPGGAGGSHGVIPKISPVQETHSNNATEKVLHPTVKASNSSESFPEMRVIPGQGADKLFSNFHKLIDTHQQHSPLIDHLLKENPHVLAQKLGFPEHNAEGYMHPGDSLKVENNQLVFHRGAHSVILMNQDGTIDSHAHAEIAKLTGQHHVHHSVAEHHSVKHAEHKLTPAEVESEERVKAIYAAERAGKPVTQDMFGHSTETAPAQVHPVEHSAEVPASKEAPAPHQETPVSETISTPAAVISHNTSPHESAIAPFPHYESSSPSAVPETTHVFPSSTHPSETHTSEIPSKVVEPPQTSPWTNSNGAYIDPRTPSLHDWRMPGTKKVFPVFYGGGDKASAAAADIYLQQHPQIGRILVPYTDPETGKTALQMHQLDSAGKPVAPIGQAYNPETNNPLPDFDPKDFIRHK